MAVTVATSNLEVCQIVSHHHGSERRRSPKRRSPLLNRTPGRIPLVWRVFGRKRRTESLRSVHDLLSGEQSAASMVFEYSSPASLLIFGWNTLTCTSTSPERLRYHKQRQRNDWDTCLGANGIKHITRFGHVEAQALWQSTRQSTRK